MIAIKETRDEKGYHHSFNDEPAIVYYNGDKEWYRHGTIHRETDAAIIYPSGYKEYWLDGHYYTFEDWLKLTPISEEDKLVLLLEK